MAMSRLLWEMDVFQYRRVFLLSLLCLRLRSRSSSGPRISFHTSWQERTLTRLSMAITLDLPSSSRSSLCARWKASKAASVSLPRRVASRSSSLTKLQALLDVHTVPVLPVQSHRDALKVNRWRTSTSTNRTPVWQAAGHVLPTKPREQIKLKRMVARNMVHMVHLVIVWATRATSAVATTSNGTGKEQPQEEKEIALSGRLRVNVHVEKVFVKLRARPGKRGATKRTPSPRRNSPGSTKCCRKTNKSIRE